MFRLALALLILVLASACTLGVPEVTPTVAPTRTPTETTAVTDLARLPTRTPVIVPTTTLMPTVTAPPTFTLTDTAMPVPTDSPTSSPTATASYTPTPHPSETPTLTPTLTPTSTSTRTATPTASLTPSPTFTPSRTFTPSATYPPTNTATPTVTPTPVPTLPPSPTPLPLPVPTNTPTATFTPSNTPTWTATVTPTFTRLPPTRDPTDIARQVFATATSFVATLHAEQTRDARTLTAAAPPTLDVTPTYITAMPGTPTPVQDWGIITPVLGETTIEQFVTDTPAAAPTAVVVQPAPTRTPFVGPSGFRYGDFSTGAWGYNIGPTGIVTSFGGGLAQSDQIDLISGVGTILFARSPTDPNNFILTDYVGNLYTFDVNGGFRPYTYPFVEPAPSSREGNRDYVREIAWAPNGQRFAFIIDGDYVVPGAGTDDDGVWVREWATGEMRRLVVDCPYEGHRGCIWGGDRGFLQQSVGLEWSPQSNVLLVSVDVTRWYPGWDASGQRKGALLVVPLGQDWRAQPSSLLYDYGSWTRDGSRIVVSGMNGRGVVLIGTVLADGSDEQILFNASANGWWVQNAVQRPDGRIVALGRQGDRHGAMQIIDQTGAALTDPIGWSEPERVRWSPDRSAVLVTAGGRHFVATVSGSVVDITGNVHPGSVVDWLN